MKGKKKTKKTTQHCIPHMKVQSKQLLPYKACLNIRGFEGVWYQLWLAQ